MELARHFTKVYSKDRKALSWRAFEQFFQAVDRTIISDVAYVLSGQRTEETDKPPAGSTKKDE